ncbi:MAG: hypothetical protein MUP45_01800 [Candidatus Marinimicrobia bacterium]|nr:hypothetical protein [Candidatus Neomarinimicrobiota bacterium]
MKWVAITGSWRATTKKIEKDVRQTVRKIMTDGNGIVTGGALNVDYFATDEAIKLNPSCDRIKVFLPATLARYSLHYLKRAREGVITKNQVESLISQLEKLKRINPQALIENNKNTVVNKRTYFERNTDVIKAADELVAFHASVSHAGVQDTVAKAKERGFKTKIFKYKL